MFLYYEYILYYIIYNYLIYCYIEYIFTFVSWQSLEDIALPHLSLLSIKK